MKRSPKLKSSQGIGWKEWRERAERLATYGDGLADREEHGRYVTGVRVVRDVRVGTSARDRGYHLCCVALSTAQLGRSANQRPARRRSSGPEDLARGPPVVKSSREAAQQRRDTEAAQPCVVFFFLSSPGDKRSQARIAASPRRRIAPLPYRTRTYCTSIRRPYLTLRLSATLCDLATSRLSDSATQRLYPCMSPSSPSALYR